MPTPNTPRIRKLLDDLAACQAELAQARTADHAACARSDMKTVRHSLWLAGYPED